MESPDRFRIEEIKNGTNLVVLALFVLDGHSFDFDICIFLHETFFHTTLQPALSVCPSIDLSMNE